MSVFDVGDIAVGGQRHYIEVIHADGSFSQMVHVVDENGEDSQQYVTGVAFRPTTRKLYSCSTPDLTRDYSPHDIDWIPDDTGLLVAVVPAVGVLEFWKYDFDGSVIDLWTPAVEGDWVQQPVKISVACDGRTVFYSQSLSKIQRYDLVARTQLADYQVLPLGSDFIFGGLRVLPLQRGETAPDDYDVVVAMTSTGDGPQRALCLAADGLSFWTDEANVDDGGTYHVNRWQLSDRLPLQSVVTQADLDGGNDQTLALSCNYNFCSFPGLSRYSGAAGIGGVAIYGPPL